MDFNGFLIRLTFIWEMVILLKIKPLYFYKGKVAPIFKQKCTKGGIFIVGIYLRS